MRQRIGGTSFGGGRFSRGQLYKILSNPIYIGRIPHGPKSHAGLPPALLVTCGFDMLRDVGHAYARKLAAAGNDLTYVHFPDLPHGIIQMTMHSKACLEATEQIASLLGERLARA